MKIVRLVVQPFLLAVVLAIAARGAVRFYSIPSASMEPTLRAGDSILTTLYHHDTPHRGDVVVFHSPANPRELLIKRIVAVPGDLVETRSGRLVICGHTVSEPYLASAASTGAISPQVIPAESYFVLGDNRGNSFDSRAWGILPRSLIIGRARLVLWSSAGGSMTPRANAAAASRQGSVPVRLALGRLFRPIE